MNSHANIMPIEADAVRAATFKQRLSLICYLAVVTVAMLGWLAALGWAAITLARWSFF
jgi:hypothetical protein